jgi:thiol-disulfide isomerase/thioredoxin
MVPPRRNRNVARIAAVLLLGAGGIAMVRLSAGDGPRGTTPTSAPGIPVASEPDGREFEFVPMESMDGSGEVLVNPGEFAVVNFWFSTCPPCAREMPALAEVARMFEGRVSFIGVNPLDDAGPATAFLERYDVGFPSYLDDGDQAAASGIVSFPFTYFLRDGRIIDQHAGEITRDELLATISERFGLSA